MEARGAVRLSLWTSLSLLLISGAAVVTMNPNVYLAGEPVTLDIPGCKSFTTGHVEWKTGPRRLLKKKSSDPPKELNDDCQCKIHSNGSLYIHQLKEGDTTYTAEMHGNDGKLECNETVTVTGQYSVDTPSITYKCKDKKIVELNCSISHGSDPELQVSLDGQQRKKDTGIFLSLAFQFKNSTNVSCTAKNKVSEKSKVEIVICEVDIWEWYVYLVAGAGGVAFIIFVVLFVYSVRTCKTRNKETVYNNERTVIQERQLPQPPGRSLAEPQDVTITNETEYASQSEPPHRQRASESTASGKKGRRTRPRPPEPPNGQQESLPLKHQSPTLQKMRPPLPGNHPNNQAPRPTPRTKSKPPRQNRQRH